MNPIYSVLSRLFGHSPTSRASYTDELTNPCDEDFVDVAELSTLTISDLEKVVSRKIKNSKKPLNTNFFVVSTSSFPYDNTPRIGEIMLVDSSLELIDWVGHLNWQDASEIVIPNAQQGILDSYLFNNEHCFRRTANSLWADAGYFDYQKYSRMIPHPTNISKEEILSFLSNRYEPLGGIKDMR